MATLKISELSVGDWVEFRRTRGIYITPPLFDHANAQVIGIHRGAEVSLLVDGKREFIAMPLSAIRPIPITAEILEKNGFEKNSEYNEWNIGTWRTPYLLGVSLERPAITIKWNGSSVFIDQAKYIHQLQHALRLAGVDKEINL